MNLAKVRSAIGVTIALAVALVMGWGTAQASARVTIAWLPQGTAVEQMAAAGLSPGLMSAGLGSVPTEQTYLDISQGNRVFDSLYDAELPAEVGGGICGPAYSEAVVERAQSAPAEIVPGLLAEALAEAGQRCEVRRETPAALEHLAHGLRSEDLLIAIERPPPQENRELAIGIAGRGFDGNLTSDSTRTDGYVLSTDVGPTVLAWFGTAVPAEMTGEPIRAEGDVDPGAVVALADRMAVISERRGPVIGLSLLVWLVGLGVAVLLRRARFGARLVCLAVVYLPLVLLTAATLEPTQGVEMALAMGFSPLLGLATLAALGGYRALGFASGLTVSAYAIDVIAGSPLTSLSLLGPNPGLGVRFYGIGNELEASLAVLIVAGTGALLTGFARSWGPGRFAAGFLAIGVSLAAVFAAGRFGADVGAAIVLPFGAAVAAAVVSGRRWGALALALLAPAIALAVLAAADLASGGNAHLTRSVLDAGGLGELGDVAQRRLQLSAHSFGRPIVFVFMPLVVLFAVLAFIGRAQIATWMAGRPAIRAGLLGALAAVAIGALANDSGALVLEIGAAYLLAFLGFVWAESDSAGGDGSPPPDRRQKIYTPMSHTRQFPR